MLSRPLSPPAPTAAVLSLIRMSLTLARHPRFLSSFLKLATGPESISIIPFSLKAAPVHIPRVRRPFSVSARLSFNQSQPLRMEVELTAPNGKTWSQPLGLFINNEFVKSSNEQKLASINPAYVISLPSPPGSHPPMEWDIAPLTRESAPRRRYALSTQPLPMTSMPPSALPARPSRLLPGSLYLAPSGALS